MLHRRDTEAADGNYLGSAKTAAFADRSYPPPEEASSLSLLMALGRTRQLGKVHIVLGTGLAPILRAFSGLYRSQRDSTWAKAAFVADSMGYSQLGFRVGIARLLSTHMACAPNNIPEKRNIL